MPIKLSFTKPNNLQKHHNKAIKHTNHHILSCTDTNCIYLEEAEQSKKEKEVKPNNLEELSQYYEHSSQLLKSIFQKSYIDFPKQENEIWQQPKLDSSLFYKNSKHEASFDKQIPTTLLDKLASDAENSACKANNVSTNSKRRNYYFYLYLNLYQNIAAQNYNIDKLNKQQAIDFLTTKPISTEFLARILTFYHSCDKTLTYPQITNYF